MRHFDMVDDPLLGPGGLWVGVLHSFYGYCTYFG